MSSITSNAKFMPLHFFPKSFAANSQQLGGAADAALAAVESAAYVYTLSLRHHQL